MELQKLVIDEKEHIYLDGVEIPNVKEYTLKKLCRQPAELTLTIYVTANQVYSELKS